MTALLLVINALIKTLTQSLGGLLLPFLAVVGILIVVQVALYLYRKDVYEKSEYYALTKYPYRTVLKDTGLYGEYLIYKNLRNLPGEKKFLFNSYVPKGGGGTTEIDVIMLHSSGIYVFESKNYSGAIYGTETHRTWTQVFRNGHKEKFYNPLMQNNTHIKWLQAFLPEIPEGAFFSVIAFSDRCRLQKINLKSNRHMVMHRRDIYEALRWSSERRILSEETIDRLYQKLYPLTQVSGEVKQAHIGAIIKQQASAPAPVNIPEVGSSPAVPVPAGVPVFTDVPAAIDVPVATVTDVPTATDAPGVSNTTDVVGTPDCPADTADSSGTLDFPDAAGDPVVPDVSAFPDVIDEPGTTADPGKSGRPGVPDASDTTEAPDTSDAPEPAADPPVAEAPNDDDFVGEYMICAQCGADMVLRTATRGERKGKKFWGCSNYPKCRNVINVD